MNMESDQKEETEDSVSETTFSILSDDVNSEVNTDVNLSSLSNITEVSGTADSTSVGSDATGDGICTATSLVSGTSLIPENLVLVETSKGLVLSTYTDGVNGSSFGTISTSVDEQGRQLLTPTLPVALFNGIQQVGIVDGQENGLFGSPPDGITVATTTSIFEDPNTSVQSASAIPVQLIPTDIVTTVASENTPSSPEKRKKGGGWPKGKKRKIVPNIQAPKKPATGYVLFAIKRRQQIKVTNPGLSFSEVTKMLGQEWTSLHPDTKKRYLQLADKDKKRYIQEMKDFQQSEHYQNYLKKKKLSENDEGEMDSLIDLEDNEGLDELQCKICNQYFISVHNKKEHMFGRQHLLAITNHIQKDIQLQAEMQKQQVLDAASVDGTGGTTLVNGDTPNKHADDKPVDVEGFIQEFMRKNLERENEINQLMKSLKAFQEENEAMTKQMKELQELETKLDQDTGSLKAYGSSLTAQIDTLKMVPTLFGVINF